MRRTSTARSAVVGLLGAVLLAAGCSAGEDTGDRVPGSDPAAASRGPGGPAAERSAGTTAAATSATPPVTTTSPTSPREPAPEPKVVRLRGIDASHHQGPIDWPAVVRDGISFAYLKATEGTSFTDPTFAAHRREAVAAGVAVGGYHYFQLCTPGAPQAEHFLAVLGDGGRRGLPPALDLELAGSCATPPPRQTLLAEVRTFLDLVERRTGRRPVVYLYPELEERFGFARDLADHRQWVRSLDGRPDREWWIWQQSDSGTVDGIGGPVDINVMRRTR